MSHIGRPVCAHCGARLAQGGPVVVRIISPRGVVQQQLDRLPASLGRRDPARQHFPDIDLAERDRGLVSRAHARIERQNGHLVIIDVGSKNGTRVNGTMLVAQQAHPLVRGYNETRACALVADVALLLFPPPSHARLVHLFFNVYFYNRYSF